MIKIIVNLSLSPMTQTHVIFLRKNIEVDVLLLSFASLIAAAW